MALDEGLVGFIPKETLNPSHLKALLAYLNSNFVRLFIETHGRATGGGLIELDVSVANTLPILDVRRLNDSQVKMLATLFDKLENETRRLGGADTLENIDKLAPIINEIDDEVAKIIKVPEEIVKATRNLARSLMERRLARVVEAEPETIRGEEKPRIKPPRKARRTVKEAELLTPLDKWLRVKLSNRRVLNGDKYPLLCLHI
jgi:hypothetical protein